MQIAHFVQRYPPAIGGAEAYFQRISRYFANRGHVVVVWTTTAVDLEAFWTTSARALPPEITMDGPIHVRRYPMWRWPLRRYLLKALSSIPHRTWQALTMPASPFVPQMWRETGVASEECDLVHATAFPYAFPIACARRLARRRGVPFLLTPFLHLGDVSDPRNRTLRAYLSPPLRSLLLSADRVFAQTPSEQSAVIAAGVPPERVVMQGLGVEAAECTGGERATSRIRWRVDTNEVVIGHLANLSHEKGTIDLLIAAATLWARGLRFRIILAGPEMSTFRRFWEGYSHRQNVSRLGVLSEEQKRDFFAGLDMFALPSRSDSFGLVLLEAWANGLANIAYRAGGIADVIQHERDGLLVRCGDTAALADAIARLTGDPDLRRRLGESGRARLQRDFRWTDKLAIVEQTYHEAAVELRRRPK